MEADGGVGRGRPVHVASGSESPCGPLSRDQPAGAVVILFSNGRPGRLSCRTDKDRPRVSAVAKGVQERERVIVRFAGDSGDGMQLVGGRFTDSTATLGNDLATLPNFPAEIRAPAGTLAGVSSFQIHFASRDIVTPGDTPNVLIAMNPAALKANIGELERGATIIANEDAFTKRNLQKAGYDENHSRTARSTPSSCAGSR